MIECSKDDYINLLYICEYSRTIPFNIDKDHSSSVTQLYNCADEVIATLTIKYQHGEVLWLSAKMIDVNFRY